jgi:hypothetical protein
MVEDNLKRKWIIPKLMKYIKITPRKIYIIFKNYKYGNITLTYMINKRIKYLKQIEKKEIYL